MLMCTRLVLPGRLHPSLCRTRAGTAPDCEGECSTIPERMVKVKVSRACHLCGADARRSRPQGMIPTVCGASPSDRRRIRARTRPQENGGDGFGKPCHNGVKVQ